MKKKTKHSSKNIEEQLKEFLYSSENTISIEEAIKKVDKKWPNSR